tara:strand:+ start:307 stop:408 length:102 start_codon:yes stop_codon:yes gene_type:complete
MTKVSEDLIESLVEKRVILVGKLTAKALDKISR